MCPTLPVKITKLLKLYVLERNSNAERHSAMREDPKSTHFVRSISPSVSAVSHLKVCQGET